MWKQGAILHIEDNGYVAIEDIWNACKSLHSEYISTGIIEDPDNSEWFERVYPDTISGKLYRTKDQLVEIYNGAFKS